MKVSIIVPVYNAEKFLKESIESAINQTYPDTEIIAVNNGSTDRSLEILKQYSNKIKIISKEHGGVASARNAGLKVATGEWIKFLDSDDVLFQQAVEELVLEADKIKDKNNTLLYANVEYIDSQGKTIGRRIEENHNDLDTFDFNIILLDSNIGIPSTWLLHKSAIEKYGMFDENMEAADDDYEFHLRYCVLHNCRLHLVPKIVAKYRFHQDQASWVVMKKSASPDKIAKMILEKLNPQEREKYEIALKQYRGRRLLQKIERCLGSFVLRYFSTSLTFKIQIRYGKIKKLFYVI